MGIRSGASHGSVLSSGRGPLGGTITGTPTDGDGGFGNQSGRGGSGGQVGGLGPIFALHTVSMALPDVSSTNATILGASRSASFAAKYKVLDARLRACIFPGTASFFAAGFCDFVCRNAGTFGGVGGRVLGVVGSAGRSTRRAPGCVPPTSCVSGILMGPGVCSSSVVSSGQPSFGGDGVQAVSFS